MPGPIRLANVLMDHFAMQNHPVSPLDDYASEIREPVQGCAEILAQKLFFRRNAGREGRLAGAGKAVGAL